jgi:hypothetical protein
LTGGDLQRTAFEANCARNDSDIAGWCLQAIFAALVCADTDLRANDTDGRFGDRCSRTGLSDFACDLARLSREYRWQRRDEGREREDGSTTH